MGIENENVARKNNTWIYLGIIVLLAACNLFLFFQKDKISHQNVILAQKLVVSDSSRKVLQGEYNDALNKLDALVGQNATLDKIIQDKNGIIAAQKAEIQSILANKNATQAELNRAKILIEGLQIRVTSYSKEIADLKKENSQIRQQRDSLFNNNTALNVRNEALGKQVDEGRVLHISNVRILAMELHKGQERETDRAKKADLMRVYFDIDENRLAESGPKTVHVRILSPDGVLMENASLGSGNDHYADGKPFAFSLSKTVNLETNRPMHSISVDWHQNGKYEEGSYRVEFYYQGHMIGGGMIELK